MTIQGTCQRCRHWRIHPNSVRWSHCWYRKPQQRSKAPFNNVDLRKGIGRECLLTRSVGHRRFDWSNQRGSFQFEEWGFNTFHFRVAKSNNDLFVNRTNKGHLQFIGSINRNNKSFGLIKEVKLDSNKMNISLNVVGTRFRYLKGSEYSSKRVWGEADSGESSTDGGANFSVEGV